MNPKEIKVYLASPFFNDEQVSAEEDAARVLLGIKGIDLFRPAIHSVVFAETEDENLVDSKFLQNVRYMNEAKLYIAIVDDFDPGTMLEIGYAYARKSDIILYSPKYPRTNKFLIRHCLGFCSGLDNLKISVTSYVSYKNRRIEYNDMINTFTQIGRFSKYVV